MGIGGGSRVTSLVNTLAGVQGQPDGESALRRVIEGAADPRDFTKEPEKLSQVIDHLAMEGQPPAVLRARDAVAEEAAGELRRHPLSLAVGANLLPDFRRQLRSQKAPRQLSRLPLHSSSPRTIRRTVRRHSRQRTSGSGWSSHTTVSACVRTRSPILRP